MMKMIYTFLYFSCLYLGTIHDAPIAMFKLMDNGDHTKIHITLDAEDLSNTLSVASDEMDLAFLNTYLSDRFDVLLDGRRVDLYLNNAYSKMDHIHIEGKINQSISSSFKITVRNSCLLDIDNQSNIVQFKYGEELRDFRMSEERQEIEVAL